MICANRPETSQRHTDGVRAMEEVGEHSDGRTLGPRTGASAAGGWCSATPVAEQRPGDERGARVQMSSFWKTNGWRDQSGDPPPNTPFPETMPPIATFLENPTSVIRQPTDLPDSQDQGQPDPGHRHWEVTVDA